MKKNLLITLLLVCGISKATFDVPIYERDPAAISQEHILETKLQAEHMCPPVCAEKSAKWTKRWTNGIGEIARCHCTADVEEDLISF